MLKHLFSDEKNLFVSAQSHPLQDPFVFGGIFEELSIYELLKPEDKITSEVYCKQLDRLNEKLKVKCLNLINSEFSIRCLENSASCTFIQLYSASLP